MMKSCMEPKYLSQIDRRFYSGTFTPLQKQKVHAFQEEAERDVSPESESSAHDDLAVIEKAYWKAAQDPLSMAQTMRVLCLTEASRYAIKLAALLLLVR